MDALCNRIIAVCDVLREGRTVTLRQLFYALTVRDEIERRRA